MIKVGIVGGSGYSGLELVKILLNHSEVTISYLTGTSRVAGQKVADLFPVLRNQIDIEFKLTNINYIIDSQVDCIFLATPNETSLELVPGLINNSDKKIIDLSGSFRLKDNSLYPKYYGFDNDNNDVLSMAVYGLPEINKDEIKKARLIANPGCYPTSIILPLAPLLKADKIDLSRRIIIDSKSGVSGAGRKPSETTHYVEINESIKAYNLQKHRHEPEIVQELTNAANVCVKASFTPHLIPVNRGIMSTIYTDLKSGVTTEEVFDILNEAYSNSRFVRILPDNLLPEIKHVAYTPYCDIGFSVRDKELIIVSCIDNLLKGASSQAVQNLNLMYGFKEHSGL